jgi:hypothetical protein
MKRILEKGNILSEVTEKNDEFIVAMKNLQKSLELENFDQANYPSIESKAQNQSELTPQLASINNLASKENTTCKQSNHGEESPTSIKQQ